METTTDPLYLIFSCEHGGNTIPDAWAHYFENADDTLATHRGYDLGALQLAQHMATRLEAPLHAATVSRLLVDLNRSPNHPKLFSEWSRPLSTEQRNMIKRDYYLPYRQAVEERITGAINRGQTVLHVSVHSFTAELDGEVRDAELGLLYDPKRKRERTLSLQLQNYLLLDTTADESPFRVRRNYPYTGIQDGFIPWLRKRFISTQYLGLELEFNQGLVSHQPQQAQHCADLIARFLHQWHQRPG